MIQFDTIPERRKVTLAASLFMGMGHILYLKQYLKGALFALIEVVFLLNIPGIIQKISDLIILGEPDKSLPVMQRDHSIFMMIDGILVIVLIGLFVAAYYVSIKSAQKLHGQVRDTRRLPSNRAFFSELGNGGFTTVSMAPAVILVAIFVVVPLLFSFLVAFTNYSSPDHIPPNNTVDWVGMDNFVTLFGGEATWSGAFGRVATWTIIWGFMAALTCYFGGMILAVVVNDKRIKIAGVFRTIFILPYAIPSVISMIVWKNMLNSTFGTVNKTLFALDLITEGIPWLTDATLAKVMCIVINLWAGFPYFMLLCLGTMSTISSDIYEASEIDGASKVKQFFSITLPLVFRQTAPLLILSICSNLNNFGAIFFLTGGDPVVADSTITTAKGTDIIVTWIYNLTVNTMKYNYAAALAVVVFIVIAPFAIFNFMQTKSYQEGEL